jgi:hypothetical protein
MFRLAFQRSQSIELLSISNSSQLLLKVNLGIARVCVLIILRVVSDLFDDEVLCVRMDDGVERHKGVSDKGSVEAKTEALFAVGICVSAESTRENGKDYECCGRQKERMDKNCA